MDSLKAMVAQVGCLAAAVQRAQAARGAQAAAAMPRAGIACNAAAVEQPLCCSEPVADGQHGTPAVHITTLSVCRWSPAVGGFGSQRNKHMPSGQHITCCFPTAWLRLSPQLQLEDFDPEWENREKGECERLNQVGFIAQSMPSFPSFGRGLLAGRVRGRQAGLSERRRCYFLEGLLLLCILVPCRKFRS